MNPPTSREVYRATLEGLCAQARVAAMLVGPGGLIEASTSFAHAEFDGAFDVLFVDEASQMSLANAVAIGTCARSTVLIGDPNQLPMVSQGVHPAGAAATSLGQLVGDSVTVEPERGLFLETSRRMHPDVNAFISPAFSNRSVTGTFWPGLSGCLSSTNMRW